MSEQTKKPEQEKLTEEKAAEIRILIKEEIAGLELAKAKCVTRIAQIDENIADHKLRLADIDRVLAGVDFPEPPAKEGADAANAEK